MTTIAWDGKSLAADQMLSTGDGMTFRAHKIRRTLDGRLIGAAGHAGACAAYLDWLAGDRIDHKPSFQDNPDDYVVALEILSSGEVSTHGRYNPVVLIGPLAAIGSGAPYALGAMAAGKAAADAVAIAAEFDTGTGCPVDVLDLHPDQATKTGRRVARFRIGTDWRQAHGAALDRLLVECSAVELRGSLHSEHYDLVLEHPSLPVVEELEAVPEMVIVLRDNGRRCAFERLS